MNLVISQTMNSVLFGVGVAGGLLSVYGVSVDITSQKVPWIEKLAPWLASISTILGVVVSVAGIYFPSNPRPPYESSRFFWAPLIILYGTYLCIHFTRRRVRGKGVNEYVILGYAMVGLAVTCIRQFVTQL